MASTANNVSTLQGNFKDQFHDRINDLMPDFAILQRENFIDWVPADKMNGELYSIPTLLRSNQGVTYLGESGAVATLNDAVAGLMKEAQVKGTELNVRGQLSYKAMSQAQAPGPRAFAKAIGWMVEDLSNVAFSRLEASALYGQTGIGTVESITDNTTSVDIVVTEATWAAGFWVGSEGAYLDSYTSTTKNNTGTIQLSRVTSQTRTLRCLYSGTIASDCTAGDVLHYAGTTVTGQATWNEMCGLYKQLSDVTNTLFNIDRSAYGLMQGNQKTSFGAPTKAKLVEAAMLTVEKGALSDLICLVSPKMWSRLAAEDLALRSYDSSYSEEKSKSGSKGFEYAFAGGTIKVVAHCMVKQGDCFLFNPDDVIWAGSSKVTFQLPGRADQEFFRFLDGSNGAELQAFADCALYLLKPCRACLVTGVTYS
jgi:hypothetical protein